MSDDPDRLDPADERDMQAAEYVLGVLAPAQARAVEALALHDADMGASIAAWELRLAPLAAAAAVSGSQGSALQGQERRSPPAVRSR